MRDSRNSNPLGVVLGANMIGAVHGEALSTVDVGRFLTQITLRVPRHT